MEQYINIALTLILIGIYWYNTKAQNTKLQAQSDIIRDLREQVRFFDLPKIKEFIELTEAQKDKLHEVTKNALQKEYESKLSQMKSSDTRFDKFKEKAEAAMAQSFSFVIRVLMLYSKKDVLSIIDDNFTGPMNENLKKHMDKFRMETAKIAGYKGDIDNMIVEDSLDGEGTIKVMSAENDKH